GRRHGRSRTGLHGPVPADGSPRARRRCLGRDAGRHPGDGACGAEGDANGTGLMYPSDTSREDVMSVADELQKLVKLKEAGVLSEAEFQLQKNKALGASP